MNQERKDLGNNPPSKGNQGEFDKDQPQNPGGQPNRDRSQADDRAEGLRRKPENPDAIPELDEPDVEGVGKESGTHTDATMPPGEGQNPKRNTM